jgi:quinol monooxygenase YgiN
VRGAPTDLEGKIVSMSAIRHVVMWTLHDSTHAARFKATLDTCRQLVPGLLEFEVGIRQRGLDASCDVVLVSTFADKAALDAYQAHPHHQVVSAQLGPMRIVRQVLDYDIDASHQAAAAVPPYSADPKATP